MERRTFVGTILAAIAAPLASLRAAAMPARPRVYLTTCADGDPWWIVATSEEEARQTHIDLCTGEPPESVCLLKDDERIPLRDDGCEPGNGNRMAREWAADLEPGTLFACSAYYC